MNKVLNATGLVTCRTLSGCRPQDSIKRFLIPNAVMRQGSMMATAPSLPYRPPKSLLMDSTIHIITLNLSLAFHLGRSFCLLIDKSDLQDTLYRAGVEPPLVLYARARKLNLASCVA